MANDSRYAVYFAPAAGSSWWRFGCAWVGRDALSGDPRPQPMIDGLDLYSLTAAPRRYGFHATLKAPFRLRPGVSAALLCTRTAQLARSLTPVPLGELRASHRDGFVALRPSADPAPLGALAEECVRVLDPLRAPITEEDIARRRASGSLDARGEELLRSVGYHLALERFDFHLTLSDPCDEAIAQRLIEAADAIVEPLNRSHPLWLDRLSVFVEAAPQAPMMRLADFALGAGARVRAAR